MLDKLLDGSGDTVWTDGVKGGEDVVEVYGDDDVVGADNAAVGKLLDCCDVPAAPLGMYLPYMVLLVFGFVCLDFFAFFCDGFIELTSLFAECFSPVRRIFMACFYEPQNGNNTASDVEDVKAKIRIGLIYQQELMALVSSLPLGVSAIFLRKGEYSRSKGYM